MIVKIFAPNKCINEITYIINVVFRDFLGVGYDITFEVRENFEIKFDEKSLFIDASFFNIASSNWLGKASLPSFPIKTFILNEEYSGVIKHSEIPILYGDSGIKTLFDAIYIEFDLFGTIFFLLSRYEEYFYFKADEHGRFTSESSILHSLNIIQRPLVNELVELLWVNVTKLSPYLVRKEKKFQKYISADVDNPYLPSNASFLNLIRRVVGDVIVRKKPLDVINTLISFVLFKFGTLHTDRYFKCLNWMMEINEKAGNIMTFFFITDNSGSNKNGVYSLESKFISRLIKDIVKRGHKIGVHPSYHSSENRNKLMMEVEKLKEVLKLNNVEFSNTLESRQHYLRWRVDSTNNYLEHAGVKVDNSLGFNDCIGFRSSCCYSYPWYDAKARKRSGLSVRPLVVMDCSAVNSMGLGSTEECLSEILKIKDICEFYHGEFSFLWHNSFFDESFNKKIYKAVVES